MKANERHRDSFNWRTSKGLSATYIWGERRAKRTARRLGKGRPNPLVVRATPLSAKTGRPQIGELACRLLLIDVLKLSEGK